MSEGSRFFLIRSEKNPNQVTKVIFVDNDGQTTPYITRRGKGYATELISPDETIVAQGHYDFDVLSYSGEDGRHDVLIGYASPQKGLPHVLAPQEGNPNGDFHEGETYHEIIVRRDILIGKLGAAEFQLDPHNLSVARRLPRE